MPFDNFCSKLDAVWFGRYVPTFQRSLSSIVRVEEYTAREKVDEVFRWQISGWASGKYLFFDLSSKYIDYLILPCLLFSNRVCRPSLHKTPRNCYIAMTVCLLHRSFLSTWKRDVRFFSFIAWRFTVVFIALYFSLYRFVLSCQLHDLFKAMVLRINSNFIPWPKYKERSIWGSHSCVVES